MNRLKCLVFLACILFPAGAFAQTLEQVPNLISGTGIPTGNYGRSVAIDGDLMAVGAPTANGGGAVYIHGRNIGGTNTWGLIKQLPAPNSGRFGWSVALQGDTLVVGAENEESSPLTAYGKVYIYQKDEGGADNWGEVTSFRAPELSTYQGFGDTVALDGDTLVVGAPGDNDIGKVFIFERNQGGPDHWGFVTSLQQQYIRNNARFGDEVDIDGDVIVIGAPGQAGSAFLYERNAGGPDNWGLVHTFDADDAKSGDHFGDRVSLDGDRLAVGSYTNCGDGLTCAHLGAVYIFERNYTGTDAWGQRLKIIAPDQADDDDFGRDVLLQGDRLLVGATGDDDNAQNSGSVYVFDRMQNGADSWGLVKKLQAFDAAADDWFGFAIAAEGSTIAIGARNRASDAGGVYFTGPTPNPAPVAQDQDLVTDEDTVLSMTLSAVDTDPLTYTVTTSPSHGTLTGAPPHLTYTPDANYHGDDMIEFVADDGTTTSAPATIHVTVTSVNDAPIAADASRATVEGAPVSIALQADDVDGDSLTFEIVSQPSNGSLSGTAPDVTYTPDPGFVGEDTFTFVANDGEADSDVATVTIGVNADNPDNHAPSAQSQTIDAVAGQPVDIELTGADPDGDGIDFQIATPPSNGTLSGAAPHLTYTADAAFTGTDSFTFITTDGALESTPASVTINVSAPQSGDNPPVVVKPNPNSNSETAADGGCGCSAGGGPSPMPVAFIVFAVGFLLVRRRTSKA